jgi:hypothetical protein
MLVEAVHLALREALVEVALGQRQAPELLERSIRVAAAALAVIVVLLIKVAALVVLV